MKFVIAPDAFKGSLSALDVCDIVGRAIAAELPDACIESVPMADGGEGTLDALVQATGGHRVPVRATGPMGEPVDTVYGVLGDGETVVVEIARVVGLTMVPEGRRQPLQATTTGVGEVLRAALAAGYRKFIVGLGGSATNDGGLGMLQALGVGFYDEDGRPVDATASGLRNLRRVAWDTIDERIYESSIEIASDVTNPLCGPRGATAVYGPQKGVSSEQAADLDRWLHDYARLVEARLHREYRDQAGAGAAGGLGFAFLCLGGRLLPGAELVARAVRLREAVAGADWVVTGEGMTDSQTLYGKVPFYVAQVAAEAGVPCVLISGSLADHREPLRSVFASVHAAVARPMTADAAMRQAEPLLYEAARNVARLIRHAAGGSRQSGV